MTETLLEVEDIAKSFVAERDLLGRVRKRVHAVTGVSFTVERDETVAVVGESGAGKSTLGRLVLRLIEPDRGVVRLSGVDLSQLSRGDMRSLRSKARMIFQDPFSSLDPTMTIGDTLAEELLVHKIGSAKDRRERVAQLLSKVGMSAHHLDRFPYEFSGGQLQRVAVARAVITDPSLVVCDEPVASLDMSIRAQVINLLHDLQDEYHVGLLFISHDLSLVRHIADRVIVMYRGSVVETGPTAHLFEDPLHPYTKALLAAIPVPDPARRHYRRALGNTVDEQRELQGCDYADRCPKVHDPCLSRVPPTVTIGDMAVACHLYPEAAAGLHPAATGVALVTHRESRQS